MKFLRHFRMLALLLPCLAASIPARAQVELDCPSGSTVMPTVGTTYDVFTGFYRKWLCYDSAGNVTATLTTNSTAFSSITSGLNTQAAMQVGNGASISPVNFGRVISTAWWINPSDAFPSTGPTWTANNSAGSLTLGHTFAVEYTFVSPLGETTPTAGLQQNITTAGCVSGTCQIVAAAPVLPTGYTGATYYARDVTNVQSMQQISGCVNITGTCTFGSIPTTISPPTTNAVLPLPTLAKTSVCPANTTPTYWIADANGNMSSQEYISYYYNNGTSNGPQGVTNAGVPVMCRPFWINNSGVDAVSFRNSMFLVRDILTNSGFYTAGQRRSVGIFSDTPTNWAGTAWGFEGTQGELDFNCNGCTINGSPDGEVATASYQLANLAATSYATTTGTAVIRAEYFRSGAAMDNSNSVFNGIFLNNNTTAPAAGSVGAIYNGTCNNSGGATPATNLSCVWGKFNVYSGSLFGNGQIGWMITANGGGFTPLTTNKDYLIRNDVHGFFSNLNGIAGLIGIQNTDLQALPVSASVSLTGALTTNQITNGWTTGYTASCSGGGSTYAYTFVAVDSNGGQSVSASTNNANVCTNPLTAPNPITLTPGGSVPTTTVFAQAIRIDVYRTSGPMGLGKIGSLTCNNNLPILGCSANFVDSGIAAGVALPTLNTTGSNNAYLYGTTTNCGAVGSAASPSVAACGSASAGTFSCATNAVNTCTVNTSAVTANSQIFLTQREDATTGTRLGVTCNTTASVVIAAENVTAVVAGVSFSFGLTQPVTNPNCYSYFIVNQ